VGRPRRRPGVRAVRPRVGQPLVPPREGRRHQRKLDAADALGKLADDAGFSLIDTAIAFVLRHPAVTSAIIGPRTMEHLDSQLAAADVELTADVLDRIDEIVPPGVTINPADNGWVSPSLQPSARRR
jgi:aryl-alcohol dehydrogenase-like predicted oxidoreductase